MISQSSINTQQSSIQFYQNLPQLNHNQHNLQQPPILSTSFLVNNNNNNKNKYNKQKKSHFNPSNNRQSYLQQNYYNQNLQQSFQESIQGNQNNHKNKSQTRLSNININIQQNQNNNNSHYFIQQQKETTFNHQKQQQLQLQQKSNQIKNYFFDHVNPVFQPLIINLVKYRPEDILSYCIKWFKDKKLKDHQSSDQDQGEETGNHFYTNIDDQQFATYRRERFNQSLRKKRLGVSSQVYGPYNKRKQFILKNGSKKQQQTHLRILFFISNSFLFKNFTQIQINLLIQSMTQKQVQENQILIKEGESGDNMYIVDSGYFQCFQNVPGQSQPRILRHYLPGDTFGQLLLLHNNKRSASIMCKKAGRLYSLSRQIYKHFKKMSIIKKKLLYIQVLKKIDLFKNFTNDQYQKICDVMMEASYDAGKFVIMQGDIGNKFYIILQGVLVALKGHDQKIIQCYKQGDYFGELALLNDQPRNASVKCLTKCTLVYLTQNVFKRIIDKNNIDENYQDKYKRKPVYIRKRNQ